MDEHLKSDADPHYEDTTAPQNPPNSMVRPAARRNWLASSLGIVALIAIVVAAGLGWVIVERSLGSGPLHRSDPETVGTSGARIRGESPGGFNPTPRPNNTADEIELRGDDAITSLDDVKDAAAGAAVRLTNVTVDRADAAAFTIRDDRTTATVVAPGGMPTVRAGQRVNIRGTIDVAGATPHIRASRIDIR